MLNFYCEIGLTLERIGILLDKASLNWIGYSSDKNGGKTIRVVSFITKGILFGLYVVFFPGCIKKWGKIKGRVSHFLVNCSILKENLVVVLMVVVFWNRFHCQNYHSQVLAKLTIINMAIL